MNVPSVMLAAGGTGGHLFPALALAQELGRRGYAVDLMTDMRGDRYGSDFPAREIYLVPSATIGERRSALDTVRTVATLARGILTAYRQLASVKPGAVIGFGGYPSFPPVMAAWLRRIPTAIHEQNSVLGRANRLLASRVTAIATSFPSVRYLDANLERKVRLTGNPVRDAVIDWSMRAYVPPAPSGEFTLLVFGGSRARGSSRTCCPRPSLYLSQRPVAASELSSNAAKKISAVSARRTRLSRSTWNSQAFFAISRRRWLRRIWLSDVPGRLP